MSDRPRLFGAGPTEVREPIRAAAASPLLHHRSAAFEALVSSIAERLAGLLNAGGPVVLLSASATGAMEAALRNLVRPGRRVLCVVSGAWGKRFADIAGALGQDAIALEVPYGRAASADQVAAVLETATDVDAVAVVMNETSTGVVQPVADIARVVKQDAERLLIVDAVSAMAAEAIDVDGWGLDVCLAGLQKGFACPPGAAVMALSEAALARAEQVPDRGWYLDLVRLADAARRSRTLSTPPMPQLFALDTQLDRIMAEGMEARRARHVAMAEATRAWALDRFGAEGLFAAEGCRSITVTAVANTRGVSVAGLIAGLAERYGVVVGQGYAELAEKTFRVGHMGDHQPDEIRELLGWIDTLL